MLKKDKVFCKLQITGILKTGDYHQMWKSLKLDEFFWCYQLHISIGLPCVALLYVFITAQQEPKFHFRIVIPDVSGEESNLVTKGCHDRTLSTMANNPCLRRALTAKRVQFWRCFNECILHNVFHIFYDRSHS